VVGYGVAAAARNAFTQLTHNWFSPQFKFGTKAQSSPSAQSFILGVVFFVPLWFKKSLWTIGIFFIIIPLSFILILLLHVNIASNPTRSTQGVNI
jgi:hypothetical protein